MGIPFGFALSDDKMLAKNTQEQEILSIITELYSLGVTNRDIIKEMAKRNPSRRDIWEKLLTMWCKNDR